VKRIFTAPALKNIPVTTKILRVAAVRVFSSYGVNRDWRRRGRARPAGQLATSSGAECAAQTIEGPQAPRNRI